MSGKGGDTKRRRSAPKVKSSLDFLARLEQPDTLRPSDFLLDVVNQRATHLVKQEDGTRQLEDLDVTFQQRFDAAVKLVQHELPKLHSIEAEVKAGALTHEEALAQLEAAAGPKTINVTPGVTDDADQDETD